MNKTVSLYLNAARFTAAMMVFLSHLSKPRITHGFLGFVPDFSSEAVDAFFVISGFVIAYVTFQTEHDATSYSIRRAARIYSVALPAIVLTLALDAIGMTFGNPAPYLAGGDFDVHHLLVQILSSIFFTGGIWDNNIVIGTNSPYWSLSFEVTYYVAFGLFIFMRGWARFVAPALLLICAGPQIAIMLPVWLLGVAAFWICRSTGSNPARGVVILLLAAVTFAAFKYVNWRLDRPLQNPLGLSTYSNTFEGYVYGVIFAASIIGIQMAAPILAVSTKIQLFMAWIADRTFAIYLFHLPLMHIVVAMCPWPNTTMAVRLLVLIISLAACFALAELTERRKHTLRHALERAVAMLGLHRSYQGDR